MTRDLHHDSLSLPAVPAIKRKDENIGVWHDAPATGLPATVVLEMDDSEGHWMTKDLLPSEARALAALLINAAEHQERRDSK